MSKIQRRLMPVTPGTSCDRDLEDYSGSLVISGNRKLEARATLGKSITEISNPISKLKMG